MNTTTVTLPSMETTFTISAKGNETKQQFDGTFTYKRLTLGKRLEAAKMQSRLLEDRLTLSDDVVTYAEILGTLRFGLIHSPQWWQDSNYGLDLFDANIIVEINKAVDKFEKQWTKEVNGDKEEEHKKAE